MNQPVSARALQSSAESPARLDDLIETVACPNCGGRSCRTIKPASYPKDLTRSELLRTYSASSDHVLFDAMVQCDSCQLVYLNPRIRKDLIIESYASAVDPTFIAQNDERIATFKKSLQQLARRHGITPQTAKRVLDVGCAGGAFPKAAHDLGFDVVGVEPSRWLAEQGRSLYGLDIRPGLLEEQDFPDRSFDLISLWDVIEHLPDAHAVVSDIHRLLKPGGYLIVNCPDHGSLARKLLGSKWPMLLSVHLIYFTRETITDFLKRENFEVVEFRPFWQTLQLGYVLKRASAYFGLFGLAQKLTEAVGLHRIPLTYNIGQSFVLARRTG
ncbi:MAG: class I SAM-dependent methyltransferase [Alphaproteobacteria bacterium]|nr:MAG: class I SAM-dependent methyltransferase [Alphaproteobacteria bacterium]